MYSIKPFTIDAKKAHREGLITYLSNGKVLFFDKKNSKKRKIPLESQFNLIRPTFDDLSKALSSTSNSPIFKNKMILRNLFDKELMRYEKLTEIAVKNKKFEPDYGTYVFDYVTNDLYLIAPLFWHRLTLVTNNSKLHTSKTKNLSWQRIREIFDNSIIGFVGASVGGNILEGVMREIRPKRIKIADYDWIELTNLNRIERGSIQFITKSKALRSDPKEYLEILRVNKAEAAAYQQNMVDPYAEIYVYPEGIHSNNIDQFLIGNSKEPKIDILIEECDDFRLKVELREKCRKYKIPVLMLSDFGHLVQGQFQNFKKYKNLQLGYKISDKKLQIALESALSSGKREDRFDFMTALCGDDFKKDEFGDWVLGLGEQPTSSLPQSGATALASGGIGGKVVALYLLGFDIPQRFIYDLKNFNYFS